ncbi:nitroreductase family protein [Mycoplasmopsis fermentans]|uniref:Nitroreductase domain-containing protein n=3 Tax=Mycoplasmopsis fermentans TaxID=2115 RepID=C4XDU9_MYCFP|nr:nitroreductase family protein [Mycoplasmopsis fermentans]VEU67111.1 putative NADPH-dependent oxidoreductase [Mesomycoplasma conjunctivae]ADN69108.1 putative NADPH-linked nitro/flavin oxidoreductase [Mycoplasmopsis fermentans JER]ADV34629.1 NADPH flavin oxidoreductase [Mycoplasmopsis fermentans M64]RMX35315.1 nitroreductase family protein [Mycoplasmopsis fermentans MF-I2]VEU63898.1 putative NADPH-dependent oxidoreductase [Mycoplasmopsis fermentans]
MSFIENNLKRGSTRDYQIGYEISEEDKEKLIKTIQNAPTSNNYFASSVIVIEDQNTKDKLAEILQQKQVRECSMFFIFLADNNRIDYVLKTKNKNIENKTLNSLLLSVGDAFIQATMLQDAATELDLGTCFIGGVRGHISEINRLLKIKNSAFPAVALTVGKAAKKADLKPKINRIYYEQYSYAQVVDEIVPYNEKLTNYWKNKNIEGDYVNASANYLSKRVSGRDKTIINIAKIKKM